MAKILYLGHSTFQIEMAGVRMITDPFITPNPQAANIDFESLESDLILVSHGHQDHIADLLALAQQTNALVVSAFEITSWLAGQGYDNGFGMNHGGTLIHNGLKIKMVNAVHSSSFADGSYAGNPGGFVISSDDDCVYYAGDTALHMDMKLIGMQHQVRTAIMPIGDTFTMGYEDACIAAEFVNCDRVIGMHFDTFPPIKIDHDQARNHFANKGKTLVLMEVGFEQTFN